MAKELKLRNNGIKHARMYVLKYSKIPGVLIEPCFMTNEKEYALLKTVSFRNKNCKSNCFRIRRVKTNDETSFLIYIKHMIKIGIYDSGCGGFCS